MGLDHHNQPATNGRTTGVKPSYINGRALDWLHPHDVAARLSPDDWRKDGPDKAFALCPAHLDKTASLHISRTNSALLVHCFACGKSRQGEIINALRDKGISMFLPGSMPSSSKAAPKAKASPPTRKKEARSGKKTHVATHLYHAADGTLLYRKKRYEWHVNGKRVGKDKTFVWERQTPDGWKPGLDGVKAPLYRQHELVASGTQAIHWAEGEKCADAIVKLGLVATSLPARSLNGQDLSACAGRVVCYHADADRTGDTEAQLVMLALAGIAERVVVVRYDQGDVADWLAEGRDLEAFLAHCEQFEEEPGPEPPKPDPTAGLAAEPLDEGERGILKTEANIRRCLAKAGVRVSYNAFARQRLVQGFPGYGPDLTDAAIDAMWIRFEREHKVRFVRDHFNTVLRVEAHANSFHPVRDYLAGLKWDDKSRLNAWLSTYGGAEDTPLIRQFGRLTLIGAVRRVRHPGSKFDTMLVLEGGEGRNKSTLFEILCGAQWFSDDAPLNAEPRETIERLRGNWIIEAADLSAVKGTGVERLKAFLARKEDSATLKYERETTRAPRECIFVGTTNEAQYLQSKTGNRRFWPCRIGNIDIEALRRDRDQLWAEAAHHETAGASTVLPEELWPVAREAQEARREVDVWEEAIAAWLEGKRSTKTPVTAAEVGLHLGLHMKDLDGRATARITSAMRRAGWSKDAPGAKTVKGLRYWAPVEGCDNG